MKLVITQDHYTVIKYGRISSTNYVNPCDCPITRAFKEQYPEHGEKIRTNPSGFIRVNDVPTFSYDPKLWDDEKNRGAHDAPFQQLFKGEIEEVVLELVPYK